MNVEHRIGYIDENDNVIFDNSSSKQVVTTRVLLDVVLTAVNFNLILQDLFIRFFKNYQTRVQTIIYSSGKQFCITVESIECQINFPRFDSLSLIDYCASVFFQAETHCYWTYWYKNKKLVNEMLEKYCNNHSLLFKISVNVVLKNWLC